MIKICIYSLLCIFCTLLLSSCGAKQTKFYRSNSYKNQPPEVLKPQPAQSPDTPEIKPAEIAPIALKAPTKSIKDMNFKDAAEAKAYHEHMKNDDTVIKCAQRMLAVGGDPEKMRALRLELAELFLEKNNYTEAERYALEYQKHYPGSEEARYANYIAIKSNFSAKLTADRDQTKTEATIKLAREFLEKYPADAEYTQSIKDMMEVCYKDLITSELNVINSQLKKYQYTKNTTTLTGAPKRIAYIKEKLLPHSKGQEYQVLELELKLAQTTDKPEIVKAKEAELHSKFPAESPALAQAKKPWWHLFG
jgi:outer membrane protein assembly factor BamD (BamD/ComL family)